MSDRDYVSGLCYACALCLVHLSRIGEELVLWTSAEYGFAELDDRAATGSSMMPQKKNPDAAELARGKAGTAIGRLAGLLATLKGLPLAYNRDLQEDKRAAFDQVDDLLGALAALRVCVDGLRFDGERMAAAAGDGLTVATDVAEQLVREGVPFRRAHEQVASRVAAGERFAEPTAARGRRGAARAGRPAPSSWRAAAPRSARERAAGLRPGAGGRLMLGGVAADELAGRVRDAALRLLTRRRCAARSRGLPARARVVPGASRAVFACKAQRDRRRAARGVRRGAGRGRRLGGRAGRRAARRAPSRPPSSSTATTSPSRICGRRSRRAPG